MPLYVFVLLFLLLGVALFVGLSIRRHAHEVLRGMQPHGPGKPGKPNPLKGKGRKG